MILLHDVIETTVNLEADGHFFPAGTVATVVDTLNWHTGSTRVAMVEFSDGTGHTLAMVVLHEGQEFRVKS